MSRNVITEGTVGHLGLGSPMEDFERPWIKYYNPKFTRDTIEMEGLYASERSEGKRLADVLKVRDHVYKEETLERKIETMDLSKIAKNCRIAFSGIPSDLAGPTETELAQKGVGVFTNAGSHRMDKDVAILIRSSSRNPSSDGKSTSTK